MIGTTMTFRLFLLPNFAANQQVSNMEIITFESKAYKELDNKITAIANFIFNQLDESRTNEDPKIVPNVRLVFVTSTSRLLF